MSRGSIAKKKRALAKRHKKKPRRRDPLLESLRRRIVAPTWGDLALEALASSVSLTNTPDGKLALAVNVEGAARATVLGVAELARLDEPDEEAVLRVRSQLWGVPLEPLDVPPVSEERPKKSGTS